MAEKIYPKGLRTFPKHEKQPDFVLGALIIDPNELFEWLQENKHLLTEYKEKKQLKLQILRGDKGISFVVDTYKPEPKAEVKTETKQEPKKPLFE